MLSNLSRNSVRLANSMRIALLASIGVGLAYSLLTQLTHL